MFLFVVIFAERMVGRTSRGWFKIKVHISLIAFHIFKDDACAHTARKCRNKGLTNRNFIYFNVYCLLTVTIYILHFNCLLVLLLLLLLLLLFLYSAMILYCMSVMHGKEYPKLSYMKRLLLLVFNADLLTVQEYIWWFFERILLNEALYYCAWNKLL